MAVDERQTGAGLVHRLECEIRDAALPPGHRLGTKEELRARFRVPIGAVGAAVRALERRGVVEARPGPRGGVFVAAGAQAGRAAVAPPAGPGGAARGLRDGRASVADCLAVRDALAGLVAAEAARHATAADVHELRAIAAELAERGDDRHAVMQASWRLHRRIAAIAPTDLYGDLLDVAERASRTAEPGDALDLAAEIAFHRELVEAVAARDPDRVAAVAAPTRPHAGRRER